MPKLRTNKNKKGNVSYTLSIPKDVVEMKGWGKNTRIWICVNENKDIVLVEANIKRKKGGKK